MTECRTFATCNLQPATCNLPPASPRRRWITMKPSLPLYRYRSLARRLVPDTACAGVNSAGRSAVSRTHCDGDGDRENAPAPVADVTPQATLGQFRGRDECQSGPDFELSYALDTWEPQGKSLVHRTIPDCTLQLERDSPAGDGTKASNAQGPRRLLVGSVAFSQRVADELLAGGRRRMLSIWRRVFATVSCRSGQTVPAGSGGSDRQLQACEPIILKKNLVQTARATNARGETRFVYVMKGSHA